MKTFVSILVILCSLSMIAQETKVTDDTTENDSVLSPFYKWLNRFKSFDHENSGHRYSINDQFWIILGDNPSIAIEFGVLKLRGMYIPSFGQVRTELFLADVLPQPVALAQLDVFTERDIGIDKGGILKLFPIGFKFSDHEITLSPMMLMMVELFQHSENIVSENPLTPHSLNLERKWEGEFAMLGEGANLVYSGEYHFPSDPKHRLKWNVDFTIFPTEDGFALRPQVYFLGDVHLRDSLYLFLKSRFTMFAHFADSDDEILTRPVCIEKRNYTDSHTRYSRGCYGYGMDVDLLIGFRGLL